MSWKKAPFNQIIQTDTARVTTVRIAGAGVLFVSLHSLSLSSRSLVPRIVDDDHGKAVRKNTKCTYTNTPFMQEYFSKSPTENECWFPEFSGR